MHWARESFFLAFVSDKRSRRSPKVHTRRITRGKDFVRIPSGKSRDLPPKKCRRQYREHLFARSSDHSLPGARHQHQDAAPRSSPDPNSARHLPRITAASPPSPPSSSPSRSRRNPPRSVSPRSRDTSQFPGKFSRSATAPARSPPATSRRPSLAGRPSSSARPHATTSKPGGGGWPSRDDSH